MESCSVGQGAHDEANCHKITLTYGRAGLIKLSDISTKERELILWRSNLNTEMSEESTVCLHHQSLYFTKYNSLQQKCCDPFSTSCVLFQPQRRMVEVLK